MLPWDIILKIASSTVEMFVNLSLSYAIFRMPIKPVFKKILAASLVISIISILQREFSFTEPYAFVTQIVFYIVFIAVIYNLPFLYSLLVGLTGYISFALVQLALFFIVFLFGVSFYDISTSLVNFITFQIIESIIVIGIIYFINVKKLGFLFVLKRHTFKQRITKINFIITILFGIALMLMQTILILLDRHDFYMNVALILAILFTITVFLVYRKNSIEIKKRYGKQKSS